MVLFLMSSAHALSLKKSLLLPFMMYNFLYTSVYQQSLVFRISSTMPLLSDVNIGTLLPVSMPDKHVGTLPSTRTLNPTTTGTSVVGVKFKDGVVIAADCLGSFGSMARFRNVHRLVPVNDWTVFGASGDLADFQSISEFVHQLALDEEDEAGGFVLSPHNLYHRLTWRMYYFRSKMNPIWNSVIVGGLHDGQPFLGYVDLRGVGFEAPVVASGMGKHMAVPMLRRMIDSAGGVENVTEQMACDEVANAMRVLYYRDGRACEHYDMAVVKPGAFSLRQNLTVPTDFSIASYVVGYE